jgi:hypothetical protein
VCDCIVDKISKILEVLVGFQMVLVCVEQICIFCICTAAVELSACMIVLLVLPVVIVDKNNWILEVLVGF